MTAGRLLEATGKFQLPLCVSWCVRVRRSTAHSHLPRAAGGVGASPEAPGSLPIIPQPLVVCIAAIPFQALSSGKRSHGPMEAPGPYLI
ncbi:hypothetical protein MC885_018545 [Smutsia gigantea]|nr:hypothetical protein MC885_018545 [Smutsia gigantea]